MVQSRAGLGTASLGNVRGLASVIELLPQLVGFLLVLLVLLIGLSVAKLVANAVGKVLERVGFERAVAPGGVKKALEHGDP